MFSQTNSFSLHQRSCKMSKARLSSALASAKENFARLKRARISGPNSLTSSPLAGPSRLPPVEPNPSITSHDSLYALDSPGLSFHAALAVSPLTVVEAEELEADEVKAEEVDIFILLLSPFSL